MNRPEQQLQKAIIELADLTRMPVDPNWWPACICRAKVGHFLHFTPNGGYLTPAQRGIFKAMGLRAGVYDLCLRAPVSWRFATGSIVHAGGAWYELKSKSGKASLAQQQFSETIALMDYSQRVIRTIEEWQAAIAGYFENARPLNHDWSKYP